MCACACACACACVLLMLTNCYSTGRNGCHSACPTCRAVLDMYESRDPSYERLQTIPLVISQCPKILDENLFEISDDVCVLEFWQASVCFMATRVIMLTRQTCDITSRNT